MEDIKEMVYKDELTHFENNNEFFAQLPISSVNSTLRSLDIPDVSLINSQKKTAKHPMVPILDFTKLNLGLDRNDAYYIEEE